MGKSGANKEEKFLITCIVQRGKADAVNDAAIEAGAQGATVFYARGTGVRQKLGLIGKLITPEKEVVMIVVPESLAKPVFNAVVEAGQLRKPGKGFAYVTKVLAAVGFFQPEELE